MLRNLVLNLTIFMVFYLILPAGNALPPRNINITRSPFVVSMVFDTFLSDTVFLTMNQLKYKSFLWIKSHQIFSCRVRITTLLSSLPDEMRLN